MTVSQRTRTVLAAISGGLILVAALLWVTGVPQTLLLRHGMLAVAAVVSGYPIAVNAIQAIRYRAFSIELLVTIAVIGALAIGEFVEAAVVSFLFLFGAWLEARSLERTRTSLAELIDLAPTEATVLRNGERVVVPADEAEEGEEVIIMTGERIAVDGTVLSGSAEVSEASITGESTPVTKRPGDRIFAGTILETGFLSAEATRTGDDTTFARMIELVEEAQESKTARQRFLDRFAKYYTPAILVLAIITLIVSRDISFALTFLVIACPGALVISVPVAAVAGLGNIARHGVLIKSSETIEQLARVTTLLVDKTGTLTEGRPAVGRIEAEGSLSSSELLALAAAAESVSEHHTARAIVAAAREQGVAPETEPSEFELSVGVGVSAMVDDQRVIAGRKSLLADHGVQLPKQAGEAAAALEASGSTIAYIAVDGSYAGFIEITDRVRPEAAAALASLRAQGVKRVLMLTGDNPHVAQHVADELGIDEVHAQLLPEDKVRFVTELQQQGERIAMIGDGVNDAAALATADVGAAMGDSGTDISMETADMVILNGSLHQFAHAHRTSKATVRIMQQNMAIALGTVAILIAGVFLNFVHLASGMLVHEISVLLVILNALRLTTRRQRQAATPAGPMSPTETTSPAHRIDTSNSNPGGKDSSTAPIGGKSSGPSEKAPSVH